MQLQLFEEQANQAPPIRRYKPRLTMTHWVVIEDDSRDSSGAVWGLGDDMAGAVADAVKWMVEFQDNKNKLAAGHRIDTVNDLRGALQDGYYRLCRCTAQLAKDVHTYGGEVDFVVMSEGACTPDEFYGPCPK